MGIGMLEWPFFGSFSDVTPFAAMILPPVYSFVKLFNFLLFV